MAPPYLVEVRTGGETKSELREIINDVADEFGVRGVADPRAVPHIPLFGRYDTNYGNRVKESLTDVLSEFDVVPYRIAGFGRLESSKVVYADVVPSRELRSLRRRIAEELRPLTYEYPPWDDGDPFEFHVPIARGDVGDQLETIYDYATENYDLHFDEYATRITNIENRRMLWEYDLLQDRVLSHGEATSARSWERTESLLDERATSSDHRSLGSASNTAECIRCKRTFDSGGVQFKKRTYCDECVAEFESVAEEGVVVRSRHGKPGYDEKPYVVNGCGEHYVEHSQIEALARGTELAERENVPGLFVYWRNGSHWRLDTYLDEHSGIHEKVQRERRKIRGRSPVRATDTEEPERDRIDVRSEGDVVIDSTVVDDSVVNRSAIGDDRETDDG